MTEHLTIVDHPLVSHKLSLMRDRDTSTKSFRQLLREISHLLAYEVTRSLPMTTQRIETPLETMDAPVIQGKKLALVSILRAGNGLLDGILDLIPNARVGFVGLYRDPETLQPVKYYFKVPDALQDRLTIVVDPMLATGNSSAAAIDMLKEAGATNIRFLCLLAAPEGVARMKAAHPDVPIVTAALDSHLNEVTATNYGCGPGNAGDRNVRHKIQSNPAFGCLACRDFMDKCFSIANVEKLHELKRGLIPGRWPVVRRPAMAAPNANSRGAGVPAEVPLQIICRWANT